ncbi:MAG TPA: YdbH domain-containing protein [Hyphomonadaceae bacterium]
MTEEKLEPRAPKPSKTRLIGLVLAALFLVVAVIWLFRQPIAGGIAQAICSSQKLDCRLRVSRVDFGGITFSDVDIRAPKAADAALTASRVAIDLNWANLFSPRATFVGGDEVMMRLDFTGERPVLGDLDEAVRNFMTPNAKPGPMPRLEFTKIRVIGVTPVGPVEANGQIASTGPDQFVMQLTAPAAKIELYNAVLQLKAAELTATAANGELSARGKFELAEFQFRDSKLNAVKVDLALDQHFDFANQGGAFDMAAWLKHVRKLELTASSDAGSLNGHSWDGVQLTARIPAPQAAGEVAFFAENIRLQQGAVGRVEVGGTLRAEGQPQLDGVARVRGASLNSQSRGQLAVVLADPLNATLPAFAEAARRAVDKAAQGFEITAPWSAVAQKDGFEVSALTGASLRADSGLGVVLDANHGEARTVSFATSEGGRWTAGGSARMSGGGAPSLSIDLARAAGAGKEVSLAGAASLKPWRVGDDVLTAEATGLEFATTAAGGSASGQFTVRLDGALGGGVWKAARGTGAISSAWTPDTFYADAPRGLVIQWDEGRYGDTVFSAGALHYTPRGRLAELSNGAVVGQGALAEVKMPVKGAAFSGDLVLGATAVNWRAEGGLRAGFDAAPSTLALKMDARSMPVRIADISGTVDLRHGWRITGGFSGGDIRADEAVVADLAGKFDLGGEQGALDGNLSGVTARVSDPLEGDKRRYEPAKFAGSATLVDSVAGFSGVVTLAKNGVQLARIRGGHDLQTGGGSLAFEPTPLIFRPRSFQPSDLSPLLRGPAGVTGRVDISGGANWSDKGVTSSAMLDLKQLGFTIAALGVFEGVSGHVEIADLLGMKSAPGQTITIDKVTLGMPIEKGAIRFQMLGYDAVRVQSAEWPFAGGFIRVKPVDFRFGEAENNVTAQAVNWDLNAIVELFKIPDVKLNGVVSGDIPVAFSTGSARIEKAELVASQVGGVIQYTGSTGDAAAQADPNAKMLFDALKDFRYKVMKVGLDGDIAGNLTLTMNLLGNNPTVLDGKMFELNISVESPLMNLLNMTSWQDQLRSSVNTTPAPD